MLAVVLLFSLADLAEHTKICQNIDTRSLNLGQIVSGTLSILGALCFKIILGNVKLEIVGIKESLYLHICSSNDTVKSKMKHRKENHFQIVTFFQHVFQSFKVCNKVWIISIIIEIDCDL